MDATTLGVLTPHAAAGPEVEWPLMSAGRVVARLARVTEPGGAAAPRVPPTTADGLRALGSSATLVAASTGLRSASDLDAIGYASTTTGYALGHSAETDLVRHLAARSVVPVESSSAAAVTALQALDVRRVELVHPPWFDDEMHQLGTSYFADAGFDVVAARSVDASWSPDQVVLGDVIGWVGRNVRPEAEAVFLGGNGFRVAATVAELEAALGRPVLTANQVLLWSLLAHLPHQVDVTGYGALFDVRPPAPTSCARSGRVTTSLPRNLPVGTPLAAGNTSGPAGVAGSDGGD